MEWWNGGMVEWWNGGVVEWWIDGMEGRCPQRPNWSNEVNTKFVPRR